MNITHQWRFAMPGRRDSNLRQGDIAEGDGFQSLRNFAFVAPVPRDEDFGFDVLATIYRKVGRSLIPGNSFLVQIKATAVRELQYTDGELDWLKTLRLPLFLLSVDLKNRRFSLYSLFAATNHPNFPDWKSITLRLDPAPPKSNAVSEKSDVYVATVFLGDPILHWTAEMHNSDDFKETVQQVMEAWLEIEMRRIALKSLRMNNPVKWETNKMPTDVGGYSIMHHPTQLKEKLNAILPHVQALNALVSPMSWSPMSCDKAGQTQLNAAAGLLMVAEYMRQQGVDPDPDRFWESLLKWSQQPRLAASPSVSGTPTSE